MSTQTIDLDVYEIGDIDYSHRTYTKQELKNKVINYLKNESEFDRMWEHLVEYVSVDNSPVDLEQLLVHNSFEERPWNNIDPLTDSNIIKIATKHNWKYNKVIDELRHITKDLDITDGDLESIVMGQYLINDKEEHLYENKGDTMIDTMKRVLKESNLRRYTQRELKNLIATGQAIDLDTLPTDTNLRNNLRKLGYATSTYGLGGGLWSDTTTGEWYAIVGRSSKLFFYESKQRTPINRSNSFIIDGKLVATADYEKDAYVFRDVTNRIVKRVKSDKLRLPKDNAKAWDKLRKTFGENKTLLENAVEGDQVILVEEDYDNMSAFELFILDDDFILAHGSDTRNTMYPWDEALQEFIKDNNLDIREYLHPETITELEQELDEYLNRRLGLDIDKLNQSKREEMLIDDALYHVDELYITELEEVVENNGFVITSTPGYSQGDHYAIVTEGPYDKDFLTDVVFNTNFYKISLCEFKNYENELGENILDLDYIDTRWSTHLGYPIDTKTLEEMVLDLWGSPKYYKVDISSTYSASQIIEKLESMGLVEYIEPEIEYLD